MHLRPQTKAKLLGLKWSIKDHSGTGRKKSRAIP